MATELVSCAANNNLEKLKRLIAAGTNINVTDAAGRTALWHAVEGNYIECTTTLLDCKADVDKADMDGITPLHNALFQGSVECVQLLLHYGANVNLVTRHKASALHFAIGIGIWKRNAVVFVRLLFASGALRNIDACDCKGETAITRAIRGEQFDSAEFLLHSGAKVEKKKDMPDWMNTMIAKRCNVMSSTLVLKGVLKRRLGLSKDVTHLIAIYFWSMRLK
jgi:ankyrin repeat protein